MTNMEQFQSALTHTINSFSIDNELNTPDFILAEYLVNCLENYRKITDQRKNWHQLPETSDISYKVNAWLERWREPVGGYVNSPELFRQMFESAPCFMCGYNGHSYFNPEVHPCAKQYHEIKL